MIYHVSQTPTDSRPVLGSVRDYQLFTDYINGEKQASIARRLALSPSRAHHTVGRFDRYYDSGVGSEFYRYVNCVQRTRPMLFEVDNTGEKPACLVCSVVVVGPSFRLDTSFCRSLQSDFGVFDLSRAIRRTAVAGRAVGYLESILEVA